MSTSSSSSLIETFTGSALNSILKELQRDENKQRLREYLLDPMAKYIEGYLKPYFFTLLIVLLLMIAVLIWLLRLALAIRN
jgi:hypothetical protein